MSSPSDPGHVLRWPAGFSPECSDVWARSELIIQAPPAVVFSYLATAPRWGQHFSGLRGVRLLDPGRGRLEPDSMFGFELGDLRLSAQVTEFVDGCRLAWFSHGIDISAYHAWVISGDGDLGCSRVLAGFAARGAAAIALREPDPSAAQQTLDRWAADLKAAAESARR